MAKVSAIRVRACFRQLLPLDVALIEWQKDCDLSDEDVAVVHSLDQRRLASSEPVIPVEPSEKEVFVRDREDFKAGRPPEDPGLQAARNILAGVGIVL